MSALQALRDEHPKAVIGKRMRTMSPGQRRKLDISERHAKALCLEDHEPRLKTACALAKADHVIRTKVILDCLPDDLAKRVEHLRWDSFDDQVEFHKIILRSLVSIE